jgi:hypothetical protein
MACYRLLNGEFVPAEDPIEGGDDWSATLNKLGYIRQIGSATHESSGAEVSLFETADAKLPKYYLSIFGFSHEVASVVAADFPELVKALKELGPLIALVGLDQQTDIQAEAILALAGRASQVT